MDARLKTHVESLPDPLPWIDGNTIPWDQPDFSARMLKEHLSQDHDHASRRSMTIDAHVDWLHHAILNNTPGSVLDLGCGPGLYCQRLARKGHRCTGIDFSPASVDYARTQAEHAGLSIDYILSDMRSAPLGAEHDLAMMTFGESAVFPDHDLCWILDRAAKALKASGQLVLEVHPFEAVRAMAQTPTWAFSADSGLWSDRPYHGVRQMFWDAGASVTIQRYTIIDDETGEITVSTGSYQARTGAQYEELLSNAGFDAVEHFPSLGGPDHLGQEDLIVCVATRDR
jgi:SAM-dependent methyltransferase